MNFKNCYIIKEDSNIRKLLIEIQEQTDLSLGSNFYEITTRKISEDSYEFIRIDLVKRPFQYFQELSIKGKIQKVNIPDEKLKRLISVLQYDKLNYRINNIGYKEFNYTNTQEFYKKNGIEIGRSKKLKNGNKRDK